MLDRCFSLLFVLLSTATVVQAQTTRQVLAAIQDRYATMTAMKAHFSQTTSSSFIDTPDRINGTILLQGDAYRIETSSQTIVADGVITWVYNRNEEQVLINDFIEDENTFSLSDFLGQIESGYSVKDHSTAPGTSGVDDVLDLEPTDPTSLFIRIIVHATQSSHIVTDLSVFDENDVRMDFALSEIEFDPPITPGTFLFSIPSGVETIDLRETGEK